MHGNWKRKKLFKQGLNLQKLKQCPSFENEKTPTFRIQIWHKLTKVYYQEIKNTRTSKISQLFYIYKKTIENQNIVVENVKKMLKILQVCFFFLSCHLKDFVRLFLMQLAERLKSLCSLKKILLNYSLF